MAMSDSHRPHGVRVRLWQGSRARTSHRPYYAPLNHLAKRVHSRGDGLSSPCSGCCLYRLTALGAKIVRAPLRRMGFLFGRVATHELEEATLPTTRCLVLIEES